MRVTPGNIPLEPNLKFAQQEAQERIGHLKTRINDIASTKLLLNEKLDRLHREGEACVGEIRASFTNLQPHEGLTAQNLERVVQKMVQTFTNDEEHLIRELTEAQETARQLEEMAGLAKRTAEQPDEKQKKYRIDAQSQKENTETSKEFSQDSIETLQARSAWMAKEKSRIQTLEARVRSIPAFADLTSPFFTRILAQISQELGIFKDLTPPELLSIIQKKQNDCDLHIQQLQEKIRDKENVERLSPLITAAIDHDDVQYILNLSKEKQIDFTNLFLPNVGLRTPLTYAIEQGKREMVAFMLDVLHLSPNMADKADPKHPTRSPLLVAILCAPPYPDCLPMFDLLISRSAKVDDSFGGQTALTYAIRKGQDALAADFVAKYNANPNNAAENGLSPATAAVQKDNRRMLTYLQSHGADVNAPDGQGYTPLTYAISLKNKELASFLVTIGAEPHKVDDLGHEPEAYAKEMGIL